jgi:TonB-dependent starch-binding outer membrane protein SusC
MRKVLLMFTVLFSLASVIMAQERTISGKVTSVEDGSSLPGVNVLLKGTSIGTVTDADGNYKLSITDDGGTLVFSFIGLTTLEIGIGSRAVIDAQMASDITQLSEIVVVGYGTLEKSNISSAIGSVKGDAVRNMPVPSLDRALQGRVSGVQVNANSGIPGGATQVRIRGVGSVSGGNDPLYIIDGVQITAGDRSRRTGANTSNVLNGLNFNDIESFEVLKDAAAASIYGAQAANGVILITTKKGKSGAPKIDLNYYYGQTDIIKKLELLTSSEWINLRQEALTNLYNPYNVFQEGASTLLANTEIQRQYGNADAFSNYDWQHIASRIGKMQNADISVSGGNQNNKYYISGSYNKQDAQFLSTDFERIALRTNFDNKVNEKISFETRFNFSTVKQRAPISFGFNTNNVVVQAVGIQPFNDPYFSNGSINNAFFYPGPLGSNSNPLWVNSVNPATSLTNQFIGSFAVNYAITNDLTFRSSYALDYSVIDEQAFSDPRTPAGGANNGVVTSLNTTVSNLTVDQTLTYNKTFNDIHNINAIGGFSYRREITQGFNATGIGIAAPSFNQTLNGTTPNAVASAFGIFKLTGLFARLNYTLNDKYILSATLRRDGSSRFGSGNKFGYFPAFSAAWKMHEEGFMQGIANVVSELKPRASFGITGNQDIGNFSSLNLFTSAVAFGYNGNGGISFNNLGNPNLQWEKNQSVNFGLDFAFTSSRRVTGSVDYFIRTTKDLLLPQILPSNSGFTAITENIGELENRGWEFLVSTQNLVGEFKWSTDFNITFLKNEVTRLINEGEDLPNNGLWVGKPLGQQFQVRYAGVNPADGRSMWLDVNGNITYSPVANDRVFMTRGSGSALVPEYYGGLTNTISYKGVELSAFFQFNVGQLAFSNFAAFSASDFRFETNQLGEIKDRWQQPGDITSIPRLYPGGQEPGSAPSWQGDGQTGHDRFIDDASYLRLKQVQLSYQLPSSWISKLKLSSAKIYCQGVNLWTLTEYTGLDPEFTAGATDIGVIPQGKSFIAGVQLGF